MPLSEAQSGLRLQYINALRAIAILMVIAVHLGQAVPGMSAPASAVAAYGQMGVQLFFVVSAYTLCLSSSRRSGTGDSLASFYIRRFARIAPLYYFGIIFYMTGSFLFYERFGIFQGTAAYSVRSVLENFFFVHQFDPKFFNHVVPGGWSVATEMSFYVIFPFLFPVMEFIRQGYGRSALAAIVFVGWLLLLLLQVAFYYKTGFLVLNNNIIYDSLLNQISVFAIGIMLFLFEDGAPIGDRYASRALYICGFFAFTAVTAGLWSLHQRWVFALTPTTAALSFVFLFKIMRSTGLLDAVLDPIGRVSFSMYLFHFVFVWYLVNALVSAWPTVVSGDLAYLVCYIVCVAATIAVATVSERYIEQPGIALGRRVIRHLKARELRGPRDPAVARE